MKLFGYDLTAAAQSAYSFVPAPVKTAAAYIGSSATAAFAFATSVQAASLNTMQWGNAAKYAGFYAVPVAAAAFGAKYAYDNGYFGAARERVANVDYSPVTSAASTVATKATDAAKYGVGLASNLFTAAYNRVRSTAPAASEAAPTPTPEAAADTGSIAEAVKGSGARNRKKPNRYAG